MRGERLRISTQTTAVKRRRLFPRVLDALETVAAWCGRRPRQLPIHRLGRKGEDCAYWFLRDQGYTIVARNYRRPSWREEIDLIARDRDGTLVFVEVKTRTEAGAFPAEAAVTPEKRAHVVRLARAYLRRTGHRGAHRFDVVAVYGADGPRPEILLHRDAFRSEF